MTTPRKQQVCLEATRYYHCVSRCVRRSFLCGYDTQHKRDYEHRKSWVEKRIHLLSQIYTIDVCAYAVMSNHYHIVVHIDKERASTSLGKAAWYNERHLRCILKQLGIDEAKLLVGVFSSTALAGGILGVLAVASIPVTFLAGTLIIVGSSFAVWTIDKTTDFQSKVVEGAIENFN